MADTARKPPMTGKELFLRIIALIIVVLLVIVINFDKSTTKSPSSDSTPAVQPDPHNLAMNSTTITKFDWYKGGFGAIMMANFTIRNNGNEAVKDIEIKCMDSAPSGTVIDSNTQTIYEVVPAHESLTVRNFNMGFIVSQVSSTDCQIEDLALDEPPSN